MEYTPVPVGSQPGIKRDGTMLEGGNYVDGQWVRFYKGLPRKMAGYQSVTNSLPEIVRGISDYAANATQYIHAGSQTFLTQVTAGPTGNFLNRVDRTPAGLVVSASNLWQFEVFQDPITHSQTLIAHPGLNLTDIDNSITSKIFVGNVFDNTALIDSGVDEESGGIVVLAPYLFKFGSDGHIAWSQTGSLLNFGPGLGSGDAFITSQKIVRGMPMRNGSGGPAGIFWSLDSVIRAIFTGDVAATFQFDTLSDESSILSSQSVIEYDGIFYWVGLGRFLMFNGVVQEVANTMNLDWFFDNLNFSQRQKVFSFKVPRRGEIWFCFPFGNATECTHASIFNVREKTWYDTILPAGGRSSGLFAKVYAKPFMTGVDIGLTGTTLWQHETGVDEVNGTSTIAIPSFFETNEQTFLKQPQSASSKAISVAFIEPDFVQSGDLTVTVRTRSNARAPTIDSPITTFGPYDPTAIVPLPPQEQVLGVKNSGRLLRFKFESNVAGGDYYMGNTVAHIAPSDGRLTT
jgi:hypothetical protein